MAKGRKRKAAERKPSGRLRHRTVADKGTNELKAHRLAAGVPVEFVETTSADHPCDLLHRRGLLTDDQRRAGVDLAALYLRLWPEHLTPPWAKWYKPPEKPDGIERARASSSGVAQRLLDERRWAAAVKALGTNRETVIRYAVHCERDWWLRDVIHLCASCAIHPQTRHGKRLKALRDGLSALADMPPVRVSADDTEAAEREAIATSWPRVEVYQGVGTTRLVGA